jgi:hypothetical protein
MAPEWYLPPGTPTRQVSTGIAAIERIPHTLPTSADIPAYKPLPKTEGKDEARQYTIRRDSDTFSPSNSPA